jgi:chromosome segregation ATPase
VCVLTIACDAQEAIERFNKHIERCNSAVEQGETNAGAAAGNNETEQLRTELMRVAEERDRAIRDRDVAREELRRKSEILADMSVRLDAAAGKAGAASTAKTVSGVRGADARLVTHINNLQGQLYSERSSNRRLRGG